MKRLLNLAIIIALTISNLQSQTIEFKNGLWYNGKDFTAGTWYSSNGLLTKKAPAKIDSTIDLQKRWVVPPVGDAHISNIAGNPAAIGVVRQLMQEGFFYIRILANSQEDREAASKILNKAKSPDAAFANGGLTCTLGQPFMQFEPRANDIKNPKIAQEKYQELRNQRKMIGNGYWFLDSKKDVADNWEKIRAQNPDVLSIYLLDAELNGGKETKGLDPATAKAIAKKAKKAKIPVVAFVETAADMKLAIKLGVSGIANLPANYFDLPDDIFASLAKKGITLTPLLCHLQAETVAKPELLEKQKKFFQKLLDKKVPLAVGSNDLSRTARSEINYWKQLVPPSNAQIVKYLCETTPQAIFPNRKIGKIAEGYEASFLVLSDDPLTNAMKLRAISFMLKNGLLIQIEPH